MEFANRILDNREKAIAIWLGVFFIWALSKKSVRDSLISLLKAFSKKVILISTILMAFYIGGMLYFFHQVNIWSISYLGDTIIWVVSVAFAMFVNIGRTREDDYFRKAIWDNLKIVAFVEFVTNLYVMDLWVELILVPILATLGGVLGVASVNPKYDQVESCLRKVVGAVGVGFIGFALYNIVVDFNGFVSVENLKEFLLPLMLTLAFLPFIYVMAIYVTYDLIFMRINHLIKHPALARYAKWKTIAILHLNLRALNKWLKKLTLQKFESKAEIKQAIMSVKLSGA